jgi:hypothetical protein
MAMMLTTSAEIRGNEEVLSQESVSEKAEGQREMSPYLKLKICRLGGFLAWDEEKLTIHRELPSRSVALVTS